MKLKPKAKPSPTVQRAVRLMKIHRMLAKAIDSDWIDKDELRAVLLAIEKEARRKPVVEKPSRRRRSCWSRPLKGGDA